jgi:hypothetical protein
MRKHVCKLTAMVLSNLIDRWWTAADRRTPHARHEDALTVRTENSTTCTDELRGACAHRRDGGGTSWQKADTPWRGRKTLEITRALLTSTAGIDRNVCCMRIYGSGNNLCAFTARGWTDGPHAMAATCCMRNEITWSRAASPPLQRRRHRPAAQEAASASNAHPRACEKVLASPTKARWLPRRCVRRRNRHCASAIAAHSGAEPGLARAQGSGAVRYAWPAVGSFR